MKRSHVILVAAILGYGMSPAAAQVPTGPAPANPACSEGPLIQAEMQKSGAAIQAAAKTKSQPELCKAFKNYSANVAKLVKFATTGGVWCGIPPQALAGMKAEQAKAIKYRNRVCNGGGAPGAGGPPPPPSLSDALNTQRIPDATTTKTGRGTYDTLTGNPLTR